MKLRAIFTLILVLNFILVPLVSADCLELRYDDGESEGSFTTAQGYQEGVKFTLPANSARLVKASFEIAAPGELILHVYDLQGNDLISPFLIASVPGGWYDVPLDVWVSGDFFIALEIGANSPYLAEDQGPTVQGHSFYRANSSVPWLPNYDSDLMIRAVVCIPPPVGGELIPFASMGLFITVVILAIVLPCIIFLLKY